MVKQGYRLKIKKISCHHHRYPKSLKHKHHQSSTNQKHSTNIIQTSIQTSSDGFFNKSKAINSTNSLHSFSNILNTRYHRNELSKLPNTKNIIKPFKNSSHFISISGEKSYIHRRSLSSPNYRNKISPEQQDNYSRNIYEEEKQYGHIEESDKYLSRNIHHKKMSYASSDRRDVTNNYHRNLDKKKKKKCSHLCILICVLIIILLVIIGIIVPILLLKQSNVTVAPTTAELRWNTTGITVVGNVTQTGATPDQLLYPYELAFGSSNTFYVSDRLHNRIQKFSIGVSSGTTVAGSATGIGGRNSTLLDQPAGILVDSNDNLYIADSNNFRIQFWQNGASSGRTIAGNGTAGSSFNQLNYPFDIARDSSTDTLYIADYMNNRIMSYVANTTSGVVVAGGNGTGNNNTQTYNPTGIYFDSPSNSLIIANYGTHNVVRWVLGANKWTLIAGNLNGTYGSTSTSLARPMGVTLDPMGNIYVADRLNHRIQFFLANQFDGKTIAGVSGFNGLNSTMLNEPYSIKLDNQLNLYVTDTHNHRIQKFLRY